MSRERARKLEETDGTIEDEDRQREKQKRVERDDRGWPSRTTCPTLCLSSVKRDTFSVSRGGCKTIVRHVEARTHPSLALTHMTAPRKIPNSSSIAGFIPQRNRPDRDHPDLGHLPRSQPPFVVSFLPPALKKLCWGRRGEGTPYWCPRCAGMELVWRERIFYE